MVSGMASCVWGAGRGVDPSKWRDVKIRISELELEFAVPAGQSESAPPGRTITIVDLDRDLTRDKPGFAVFSHSWAFDGGFWRGKLGDLRMTVGVHRRPDDFSQSFGSLDILQEMIAREFDKLYTERNRRLYSEGKDRYVVAPPKQYERVFLGGREWLEYRVRGLFDRTEYATLLTSSHYLTVTFEYTDNSRGYKTNWREEAQVIADKIKSSIIIR